MGQGGKNGKTGKTERDRREGEGEWMGTRQGGGRRAGRKSPGRGDRWYSQLVEGLSVPSSSPLGKLRPERVVSSADSMALSWAVSTMAGALPPAPGPDRDCCMKASLSLVLRFMSSHLCLMSLTERGTWLTEVIFRAMPSQILSLSAWDSRMVSLPKRTASWWVTSVTRMSSSSLENLGFRLRSARGATFLGLNIPQSTIG